MIWASENPPKKESAPLVNSRAISSCVFEGGIAQLSSGGGKMFLTVHDRDASEEMAGVDVSSFIDSYGRPVPGQTMTVVGDGIVGIHLRSGLLLISPTRGIEWFEEGADGVAVEIAERKVEVVASKRQAELGLVLTCHDAYLKWLPRCLESISRQGEDFSSKVLVLDGCDVPKDMVGLGGWKVANGKWGSPNPARNLGIEMVGTPWVMFFDADNVMAPDYVAKMRRAISETSSDVAVLYPDIHFVGESGEIGATVEDKEWSRWTLSRKNFIDSSAAWRTQALEMIGGWNEEIPSEDDYWLALNLVRRGWSGERVPGLVTLHSDHFDEPGRWETARISGKEAEALWRVRSMSIVTLFSGRGELLDSWVEFVRGAWVSPQTNLLLVDNSRNQSFHDRLLTAVADLSKQGKFRAVTIRKIDDACPSALDHTSSYWEWSKHLHVAKMYSDVIAGVGDDLVLTLEDDVIPRSPDAIWRLHEVLVEDFYEDTGVGAVCAAYAAPVKPEFVVASRAEEEWGDDVVRWSDVSPEPMEVKFVGGGCTLWPMWAIRDALPIRATLVDGNPRGWDNELCLSLREKGYRIFLHGGVVCDHIYRKWVEHSSVEGGGTERPLGTVGRKIENMFD